MKYLILILGLLLALVATAAQAEPSLLREFVVVSGDRIKLGDLFTNAGDKADTVVGYAPEPGKKTVLDVQWLYRVARYFGLDWRPLGAKDRSVVMRQSQVIGEEELADQVLSALIEKGADSDMQVAFANRNLRLYVATAAEATVSVDYASYDPRSGRFSAVVSAPANDPMATKVPVTGRLYRPMDVPVLARAIAPEEVIRAADIKWLRLPGDQVRRDIAINEESLVGMAAKRTIRPDQPVRALDLRKPVLVEKNTPITMVLRSGGMTLTLKGLALQDGSEGDTVRVTNPQTKTVLEAVVTNPGTVSVLAAPRLAQLN